jgi:co-chaperonin GroES (HSP10)
MLEQMKAVGRYLIIKKVEENITKSEGGLLLSKNDRSDIRYIEAQVVSIGNEVEGVKEKDIIFYDRHAGHMIELDKITYQVIKLQDVVVVL